MIVAHGAGIDDAAFVVLPILVLAALRLLNRRRPSGAEARDTESVATNNAANS